jgi:hypothetical protein
MAIATIAQTIARGKLSIGYSANNNERGKMFGRRLSATTPTPVSPVTIAMVTDGLEWASDGGATTDAENRHIANYLIWLIGMYGMQAQARLGETGGGGSITPGGGGASGTLQVLDWLIDPTVTSQFAPLADGDISVTLDGTNGNVDFRGYNIQFSRGGVTQNTTPLGDGSTHFYWNRTTGFFQLLGGAPANGAAQTGELFRIMPDIIGGVTIENSNAPVQITLDADGTYILPSGYFIYKINIKPTVADTVRIGTTLNGEEIMMDKLMTINVYGSNGVTADVFADGADQTIYFTGFTGTAQISIYILPIE